MLSERRSFNIGLAARNENRNTAMWQVVNAQSLLDQSLVKSISRKFYGEFSN